jgi:hypothetical protein
MRECVDLRRLMVAGDDQAAAAMGEEILDDGVDPFRDDRPEGRASAGRLITSTCPKRLVQLTNPA